MLNTVFVGDFGRGRAILGEQAIDLAIVVVEHEDLAEVGAGGPEQVQAVGLGLGQGLLVPVDRAVGIVLDPAKGDEAAPLELAGASRPLETLGIDVKGGLAVLEKNALATPVGEVSGSARIDICYVGIGGIFLAQNDADEVMRAGGIVGVLHGRGDLVV